MLADEVTWKRVTGTVAASRSSTLIPAALQPTMTARLSTRAARLVSREVVTVDPFSKVEAQAMDRRTASSGLMSTLARPWTPSRPNSERAPHRLPHDGRVDGGPGLDRLERVDLDPGLDLGVGPDEALVAEHHPLLAAHPLAQVGAPAEHAAVDAHARARGRCCRGPPSAGGRRCRRSGRSGPRVQYWPRRAPGPTTQLSPMTAGPSMTTLGSISAPLPSHTRGPELEAVDVHLDLLVQDVLVGLEVGLEGAHVLPVAVGHVAEQRPSRRPAPRGRTRRRSPPAGPRG